MPKVIILTWEYIDAQYEFRDYFSSFKVQIVVIQDDHLFPKVMEISFGFIVYTLSWHSLNNNDKQLVPV